MFYCEWCKEPIEAEYMVFWRVVDGQMVDVSFLHLECEEDFMEDSEHTHWHEKFFEAGRPIYIDPVIAKWRSGKRGAD